MVGVIVENDVVIVPIPVVDVAEIKGRDAEIVASEPEAVRTTAAQAPHTIGPQSSFEVSVIPGMIEMKSRIPASIVVSDPLVVVVNVRCFRMALLISEGSTFAAFSGSGLAGRLLARRCLVFASMISGGTASRNVSAADMAARLIVIVLRERGK